MSDFLPSARRSPRARSLRGAGALGLALALATGCATAQKPTAKEVVWPLPPDKPRIRYVRSLGSAADLGGGKSVWKEIIGGLAPPERTEGVYLPTGLALSPDETRLVVACGPGHRVLEFDLAKRTVRVLANEEGHAAAVPFGVAFDAAGKLYASDSGGGVIWVYGPGGAFERQIGKRLLGRPTGIAVDRARQLVYVLDVVSSDETRHLVEVFSLAGDHLRTIGRRGSGPGEFNFPASLAIGRDGNLYVSDMLNFRVQVFDPNGDLVTMFGNQGGRTGEFGKIKGIAFDVFGNMHVVDSEAGVVQIYNAKQQFLMFYGGRGARPELMMSPTAIVIDSKNTIYVADYQNGKVQQYELFNTRAEDSDESATPAAVGPATAPAAKPAAQSAFPPK